MPVLPRSFLCSVFGLSKPVAEGVCTVLRPSLSAFNLILPLTVFAILYMLIEDTDYRPRILEVLIGANSLVLFLFILHSLSSILRGNERGLTAAIVVAAILINPATFLTITYLIDQSDWPNKKSITTTLLGITLPISLILMFPAIYILYRIDKMNCTTMSNIGF
jgi:uncharacterized membrane protein